MYRKLKDAGSFCIPLIQGTKKPAFALDDLGGFTGISEYGIPDDTLESWDENYPIGKYGIGLILGKSSNKCALDLDTFDNEILNFIPDSPLIKKGQRLGTYFYKHIPEFKSKEIFGDPDIPDAVELLNSNMMTVLPPTVHPKTGLPYSWIGDCQSLETITDAEIPVLDLKVLEKINEYFSKKYKKQNKKGFDETVDLDGFYPATLENGKMRCAHGSYNRVKKKAAQLIGCYMPIEEAVKELVAYDLEHHTGLSYFQDISRGKDSKSKDVYANALRFISSVLETVNTQRNIRGEDAINLMTIQGPEIQMPAAPVEKQSDKKSFPPITGMMKVFVDYLNKTSISENTEVYLGASLAWLSMLVASRYAVKTKAFNTPANLMIWGVMPSGVGKDSPQGLLQKLFYGHKILGASNYKSAPALLMKLNNVFVKNKKQELELVKKGQRENLIIIDECSSLLRMMSKGESYQQDMVETLNTLFSRSSGFYSGDQSVTRGTDYGAAFNPYFTLIGFTTHGHFREVMGSKIIGNGFFERSLVFIKNKKSKFNDNPERDEAAYEEMRMFTEQWLEKPIELVTLGAELSTEKEIVTEVAYRAFPISQEAEEYLHGYRKKMYQMDNSEFDDSFYNRFSELATKLALLHAVSEQEGHIGLQNVKWGIQLVEWCYSKAKPSFESMKESDPYSEAVRKISDRLKKEPNQMAPRKYVLGKIRFEPKNTKRAAFLNELIDMKLLDVQNVEGTQWIKVSVNPSSHN